MAEPNFPTSALYICDNLDLMRGMNSETIDLIATDPPFNKNVVAFRAKDGTAADGQSFTDKWSWQDDVHPEWVDAIREDWPAVEAVINAARLAQGSDTAAYLCYMAVRLIEMRRILKPAGSLYLHCDHTAGAWLKALLDAVLGMESCRNEIVWCYTGPGSPGMRQFNRKHDTLHWYSKGTTWTFNREAVRVPYKDPAQRPRAAYDTGGAFAPEAIAAMRSRGKVPEDWWSEYAIVARQKSIAQGGERTGWATQKPVALYERIILASSNAGDIVFDPFAGCSTTLVAAEKHGRRWVGCDIDATAEGVVRDRLMDSRQVTNPVEDVQMLKQPPVRTDTADEPPPVLTLKPARPRERHYSRSELLDILLARDGGVCQGCGFVPPRADYLEIDHKQPRSEGGSNAPANRVLLCSPCNRAKSDRLTLTGLRALNQRNAHVIRRIW